mgnify:CR=1 FL=1
MTDNTIAALSTPVGKGAIAVIRVSGKDTFNIISKFLPKNVDIDKIKGHSAIHTRLIDYNTNDILDDVLITFFKKPRSFTGEDIVEISCHGGSVIPYRILNSLFENGVVPAQKGEFTKRAFLNNKIDLTQAEAIADLIAAPTITGAKLALSNVFKRFSAKIDEMKNLLVDLLAHIEICIDYPDEGIPEADESAIKELEKTISDEVRVILEDTKRGRRLSAGIVVVLAGKTNAGKSSLLNYLAREERAIVSGIHGTTRDALEINIEIEGVPLTLVDTAGLRDAGDELEILGREKTHKYLEEAHLVLFVMDSSREIDKKDFELYGKLKTKDIIFVLNKSDLETKIDKEIVLKSFNSTSQVVKLSALKKHGIKELEDKLTYWVRGHEKGMDDNAVIASMRSEKLLIEIIETLAKGMKALNNGEPPEFLALYFRDALNLFGKITGEVTTEDILSRMFERFCVGK